ncbi:DRTGG domain protein [bacterium BMS3Abin07]|nr:DRTGG domain protein [bacterium BMS3Abin07]GBE32480.1 DRTGG domain protein [bacterium BMS3Bbin05]HDO21669.1 serine kinase [Nitrospirota bacterium]HDZ88512.1 serine kinase [Nitrospirota bacterium]
MTIGDIINQLSPDSFSIEPDRDIEIKDVYVSDLLSDVMANAGEGSLWITLQTHINIVAVASMKNMPAVILVNGRKPEGETVQKAASEGIALFGTDMHAFELAGRLYNMLHG